MKHHSRDWTALHACHKQQFDVLAQGLQEERRTQASDRLLKALGVLCELKAKERAAKLEGGTMSNDRLSLHRCRCH